MFSAKDMGLLAKKYYELRFTVVDNGLEDYVQLIKHLCKGYPILVPYDADRNHEPCLKRGQKAHWAVITGKAQYNIPYKATVHQFLHLTGLT